MTESGSSLSSLSNDLCIAHPSRLLQGTVIYLPQRDVISLLWGNVIHLPRRDVIHLPWGDVIHLPRGNVIHLPWGDVVCPSPAVSIPGVC